MASAASWEPSAWDVKAYGLARMLVDVICKIDFATGRSEIYGVFTTGWPGRLSHDEVGYLDDHYPGWTVRASMLWVTESKVAFVVHDGMYACNLLLVSPVPWR